jgi:5'-methylthioadenosine phosphorylase
MDGLEGVERLRVDTPYGSPSDTLTVGRLGGMRMVFLPRHGRGHRILPHEINFRANIHAMKQLGVEWILSFSAVGSMREEIRPGDLVLVDQFFDRTRARPSSFFGEGVAGHIQFADPICPVLGEVLWQSAQKTGARVHRGGTYLVIDGPQFSTRAESRLYRSWGIDVIGMTNLPEARLAREAEICYATCALATDYDCWHEEAEDVSVKAVVEVMAANTARAREIVRSAAPRVAGDKPRACACASAAQHAVMTAADTIDAPTRERLRLILGRYWS